MGASPPRPRVVRAHPDRVCRRARLFRPRAQRGPALHHQDDDRAGDLAGRADRRHARAGDRPAGEEAAGGAASRLPPQLHVGWPHDRLRQPQGYDAGGRHLRRSGTRCARRSPTSRRDFPDGVLGPFFNDEFGETFGIIYAFTADGFTHRELRDYVENVRSEASFRGRTSPRSRRSARRTRRSTSNSRCSSSPGSASTGSPLVNALAAQNAITPAGVVETDDQKISVRVTGAFGSEADLRRVNFAVERPALPADRHRHGHARLCRSARPDVPRQRQAGDRARHLHADGRRPPARSARRSRRRWRRSPPTYRSASSRCSSPSSRRSSRSRSANSPRRSGRRSRSCSP